MGTCEFLMTQYRNDYNPNPFYYVYSLANPETGDVFYIGKGTRARCYQHLKDTMETTRNKRLTGHIQKLKARGIEPIVVKIKEKVLNRSKMYSVSSGDRNHHKGFKCRKKNPDEGLDK